MVYRDELSSPADKQLGPEHSDAPASSVDGIKAIATEMLGAILIDSGAEEMKKTS